MNVHQMSVTYASEQDRILLRISTVQGEEMRLWLTRRLMLGLWPLLNQAVLAGAANPAQATTPQTDPSSQKMLAEFQREAFLQKSDFNTPYTVPDAALPLGSEPLLVSEVHVTPRGLGQVRVHFQEQLSAGASQRGFQLELAPQLSHGLVHLLARALQQAQWGFGAIASGKATPEDLAPDFTPAADRPKYWN